MPARAHFVTYLLDTEGRPIPGATVAVRLPNTETLISETIYNADDPDTATKTNPFTAAADGKCEIWLAVPKVVDLFITKTGYPNSTFRATAHQLTAATLTMKDAGTPLAQRGSVNFLGGFVLADDAGNNETEVDLDYETVIANVDAGASAAGTDTQVARGDHKHQVSSTVPGSSAPGDSVAEGTATSLARTDHRHGREAFATVTDIADVTKATESAGTAATVARGDHKHDVTTAIAGASGPGDSAAEGAATTLARSNHVHSREGYATTADLADVSHAAENAGSSVNVSRGDHKHATQVASVSQIENVAATEDAGVSSTIPRGDHRHAHGTGYAGGHTDVVSHGAADHTNVVRQLWIPAASPNLQTNGTIADVGTTPDHIRVIQFSATADQEAIFSLIVPSDWASGAIDATLVWSSGGTNTGVCKWGMRLQEIAPGDSMSEANANLVQASPSGPGTASTAVYTTFSGLVTPGSAGRLLRGHIDRFGSDAADTLTNVAQLAGIIIEYTATG
jgi:hypothetical protein